MVWLNEPLRHHFFLMITKSPGVTPLMGAPADEWGSSGEYINVQGVIYTTVLH